MTSEPAGVSVSLYKVADLLPYCDFPNPYIR